MLLFLSKNCSLKDAVAKSLRDSGIPLLTADLKMGEALVDSHDVGGAIVNGSVDSAAADALCSRLLERYPDMPIALLLPNEYSANAPVARILRLPQPDGQSAAELLTFCTSLCGCPIRISTHALTLECDGSASYLGYSVRLTPSEASVLRYLLLQAPRAVSHADLLAVCLVRDPQKSASLPALISAMNRRFAAVSPETRLIESVFGIGYRLRDGIVGRQERFW